MNSAQVAALQTLLSTPKKIAIIPHKNPDGDAIGSSLGLYHYLLQLGNDVKIVSPNDYPKFLKWMPGSSDVLNWEKVNSNCVKTLEEADAIFTLDFNDLGRTGDMAELLKTLPASFVMIDHHREPTDYAQIMFSEPEMSSTSEMVYHIIKALGHEDAITKDIASCLYAGIVTDTGSFKFSATTVSTHHVAAKLIERGASNDEIHTLIYDNNSADRLYLLSTALQNMKIFPEHQTSYMTLSSEELKKHNFKKGDTEGFVNYGLSIDGVEFTAIFIENEEEGLIKISLRSKGDFDVNTFARAHFNGGGHKNAAGGRMIGTMKETTAFFESLLAKHKIGSAS